MRNDRGKLWFIGFLMLCFLAICLLTVRDSESKAKDSEVKVLNNETVSLAFEDGRMILSGQGRLDSHDVDYLMKQQKLKSASVIEVIVGDGIEEIGYNIVNAYSNLERVKLGKDVRTVNNGSVKNCPKLRYIYLPSGLEKVGQDFLFNNDDVFVVTDGVADDLPEMKNVSTKHILTEVRSYQDLLVRRTLFRDDSYRSDKLVPDDPELTGSRLAKVMPGEHRATPIFARDAGTYIVKIYGSGLDRLTEQSVEVSGGGGSLKLGEITFAENRIGIELPITRTMDDLVAHVTNTSGEMCKVTEIAVCGDSDANLSRLAHWWES